MNKYVLRTSLFWIAILAVVAGVWAYRSHQAKQPTAMRAPMSGDMQPVASGPLAAASEPKSSLPDMNTDAPLVPIQLTPERMQSIALQTGTVEYKQLNDDIRATGTVDIDERLLSYVQVRFPGYIRKVFANATYDMVAIKWLIVQSRSSGYFLVPSSIFDATLENGWRTLNADSDEARAVYGIGVTSQDLPGAVTPNGKHADCGGASRKLRSYRLLVAR